MGEIRDIARFYFDAGSDIVETISFGGNKFKLKRYGQDSRIAEINETAAGSHLITSVILL